MINLDHLNEDEREVIEAVILRDENERLKEGQRVKKLKSELHQLRKNGAVKAGGDETGEGKVCHRCRKELGFFFDSGELCEKCNNKVCSDCHVFTPSGKKWLCTLCDKQLQIKLGSPNWVGEKIVEDQSLPSLHGSQLIKVSLENSRQNSTVTSIVDENESRRFYEDDLSYSDEESGSYGSEEPDQKKSPGRNVTFDSPLRQSAVPSDLETVSEESDDEGSTSTIEKQGDDYSRPYHSSPPGYQGETQNVEVDVHSNGENDSYVQPAPQQKRVIDTTPNLRGDEWEQMLNGRLKDASEEEEEEEAVTMEHEKFKDEEEQKTQGVGQEEGVNEEGRGNVSMGETHEDQGVGKGNIDKTETEALKMEDLLTQDIDPDDPELVVVNYNDSAADETKDSLGSHTEEQNIELHEQTSTYQGNGGDHGTQTDGNVDVHIDITDGVSHTLSVKANTLPSDASPGAPYGLDEGSSTISRRDTGGALSKIKKDDFKKASRASLASLYSNADESYRLQVTGDVNFGTSYNYKTNTFQVKILSCRDLVPVDEKRNRSSPYVKLYLLPDKSKQSKRKTNVHKATINPVYSETLRYKIRQSELESRTLCVAVWHYDRFGHNLFLGEHLLSMDTVQFDDYSAKWHQLAQRQRKSTSALTYTGDVLVAIMYEPLSQGEEKDKSSRYHKGRKNKAPGRLLGGTLHVHIKEAKNLVGMKLGGSSSPVCKCYLLPDKTKHGKKKTAVKRSTCNPKWTDIMKFDNVTRDSLLERCLEVTVWDFDSVGSNSLMGGVRLGLGSGKSYGKAVDWMDSSGKEVSVWREMLKHPNHWVETTMTLRGNVGKAKK